jgi:LacI family transcriptional regulator
MGTSISTLGQEAVRQVSEAAGFGLLYSSFGGPVRTVADDMLDGASVAGVLLYRTKNEARMGQMMDARKIPHVFVYRDLSGTQLNYVGIDFRQAMRLAVEHCVETGNRRLGVLLGDLTFPSHQAFESGFREEASRLKAEVQPGWIHSGEVSEEGGYRMATALLKGRERPGAVICTSDKIALGVLRAIHEARVRIPQDIAVVSVDGTNATAFSNPALTAVRIPWPEMFTVATRMLIELIQNSGVIGQISVLMKCEIVVRESTVRAARSRKGKSAILT